jgi:hypothetical protein
MSTTAYWVSGFCTGLATVFLVVDGGFSKHVVAELVIACLAAFLAWRGSPS